MHTIRFITYLLILTLGITGIAQAGMVNTDQVITSQKAQTERDKLNIILQRSDVVTQLKHLGVDPKYAQERGNSLTDDEALALANKIDKLPAGGNEDPGDILGAALLIFIILIITDILGYTDIFPFIHHSTQ
jgi:hypothetical protein